jgi:uncharacterized protein (UPF0276 family)
MNMRSNSDMRSQDRLSGPVRGSIPAQAGIGLRAAHHEAIVREHPAIGWLEVHSENYFADGGAQIEHLAKARALYPLSLHGVGLSLGSTDPLDTEHLRKLKRLVQWSEPAFVSEHLSWSSVDGNFLNDLLPLPYTEEALTHMIQRVQQVQDFLGRQILIENISSYLQFNGVQLAEWEFLAGLANESGCGLLVDVNNVYVSACNHGFDAHQFLSALPRTTVQELHLAGHSLNHYGDREILIDTHSAPVCDAVWKLYAHALSCFGPLPTLLEWDTDIPALDVLVAEAKKAGPYLEYAHALVA